MIFALFMWKLRTHLATARWVAAFGIIVLNFIMSDPVYFVMARIDITGGSKGWHRAQLIRSSIEHLEEWWLVGTDYTRHWMPTGIHANEIHTDITNQFLWMGVMGGLPLLILFALTVVAAFRAVGRALVLYESAAVEQRFLIWTLGAILFGHVVNFFSISYFDQSIVFFSLLSAGIAAVQVRPLPLSATGKSARLKQHVLTLGTA
jgi:hypothetical protein